MFPHTAHFWARGASGLGIESGLLGGINVSDALTGSVLACMGSGVDGGTAFTGSTFGCDAGADSGLGDGAAFTGSIFGCDAGADSGLGDGETTVGSTLGGDTGTASGFGCIEAGGTGGELGF